MKTNILNKILSNKFILINILIFFEYYRIVVNGKSEF